MFKILLPSSKSTLRYAAFFLMKRETHTTAYIDLLNKLREEEKYKLGYPESLMSVYKDPMSNRKLIDNRILGIEDDSIADKLLLNVGDPAIDSTSFTEAKHFEREVIDIFGKYFKLDTGEAAGYVTGGGTEGNFSGLWWSRTYLSQLNHQKTQDIKSEIYLLKKILQENKKVLLENFKTHYINHSVTWSQSIKDIFLIEVIIENKKKILKDLSQPILIYTRKHTHYSIEKIADQLNLTCLAIDSQESGQMDIMHFNMTIRELLIHNPYAQLIVAANIGTTTLGAIDNIPEIKRTLDQLIKETKASTHYTIHADAALLGMVLPILKPFGDVKNYFEGCGINTIAISGHKFLGASLACGVLLSTRAFLNQAFPGNNTISYAGSIKDITFPGSRSGLTVLKIHNALKSLRIDHDNSCIERIVKENLQNIKYFSQKLIELLGHDQVSWSTKHFNVIFKKPSDALMRKYQLMPYQNRAIACVLNHVNKDMINNFIDDFQHELKKNEPLDKKVCSYKK